MSKLETLNRLADSDPLPQRIRKAEDLAEIVGRMARDMVSLTEETRQTMADGTASVQRIESAAKALSDLANRLDAWKLTPIVHEAPVWPMLLAVVVMAATLGGFGYWVLESRILPLLGQCQPSQDQQAPAVDSPQTTEQKSKRGGGSTKH
jgi:hypothetical protein